MPITLRNISGAVNSDTLYCLVETGLSAAAQGAGVANTTIATTKVFPFQYKIRKVAVYVASIDAISGGSDAFNLVVGTAASYTNTNIAANDNSDTNGYPTNVAVVGNCVFNGDMGFTAANTPVNGSGWITLATSTGGYGIFVPPNYDAVYPAGIPLTLRLVTTASTGSLGASSYTLAITPIKLRYAIAGESGQEIVLPGVDY